MIACEAGLAVRAVERLILKEERFLWKGTAPNPNLQPVLVSDIGYALSLWTECVGRRGVLFRMG